MLSVWFGDCCFDICLLYCIVLYCIVLYCLHLFLFVCSVLPDKFHVCCMAELWTYKMPKNTVSVHYMSVKLWSLFLICWLLRGRWDFVLLGDLVYWGLWEISKKKSSGNRPVHWGSVGELGAGLISLCGCSARGTWRGCCFTGDPAVIEFMFSKQLCFVVPLVLLCLWTCYPIYAFKISCGYS